MLNFFKKNKNIKNDNGLNEVYSKNGRGDLIFEFTRVNGVIEGEAIHYREDGSIKKIENYKSGKLDGLTKIYDIYGVEIIDELNYVNGEMVASKKDIELKNKNFTNTENSDKTHLKNDFETPESEKLTIIKKKISSGDYIDINEYVLFNRIKDIHELRESLKTMEFDDIFIKQSFGIRHPIIQFTSNEYLDDSFAKSSKEEYLSELEFNLGSLFNKNEDNGKDYFKKDLLELFRIVKKKKSEVLNEIDNYIQNDLNNSEDIDSIKNYIDNYIQNTDLDHWNDWCDSDFLYPPCGIDFESTSIDNLIPATEIFSHISYELIQTYEIDGILIKLK